ncbi:MAG: hypothetical protein PHW62_01260, partial [Candidatus Ratteibacteria bacterium]|nr:hypothetical protein [Candidatus Ratteibacteria bacterium]
MKQEIEIKKRRIRIPLILFFIAGLLATLFFFCQEVQCYQIKRVVRDTYQLAYNAEAVTVDISTQLGGVPLDLEKSFILATRRYQDDDHDDGDIQILIDDPTHITIARYASAYAMPIEWMIVEFEEGGDVVSGTTTMPETLTTKTITLPEHFDLSKSIPVINWKSWRHSDTADERNYFSATLTDTNKLKVSRTELGGAYNNDISYQIIEFDRDVNVTYGVNTISGVTSIDVPVSVSDVDKALLFFTIAPGGGIGGYEGAYSVRGYLLDNDTLRFERYRTTNFVDIYWYLAEFQNEAFSQREGNNNSMGSSTTSTAINVNVSPQWDLSRTIFTYSFTLNSNSYNVAEQFYTTGQLSASGSDVLLTVARQTSGTAGMIAYNIMEFPPLDIITPTGGTTQIQEEQVILATQNTAASDTDASLDNTYPAWGQTWSYSSPSPGTTYVIDKVSLNMSRSSPSTETLHISIRETWNGAELTSGTFNASQLTTTDTWYDIPLTQVTLNDGQTYYIHVYGSNPSQGYVDLRYGTNQYPNGYLYRNGSAQTYDDLLFKIWEYISGEEPTYTPGDVWEIGSGYDIIWKYADSLKSGGNGTGGVHRMKLEISKGGGAWEQIPGATALDVDTDDPLDNEGTFSWPEIPAELGTITNLIGEDIKVRVTDIDMTSRNYDISNGDLIVKGTLSIYTPGVWKIGNTEDITWDYTGYLENLSPNTVTIKLSTNGGASFDHTLVTDASVGTGGSGSWPWAIPSELGGENLLGNDNVLKVTFNYNPIPDETLVESISDVFSLMGQVSVVEPDGTDDIWKIGETYDIIWDYGGNWGDVDIFVSRNNGGNWDLIDTVAGDYKSGPDIYEGKSYYSWTAEAPESIEALIRIESHTYGSAIRDESDANFEIQQVITVTEPSTAGEVWKVGEYKDIVWQLKGTVDKVEIHYKKGTEGSWIPITESEYPTGYPAGSPYKYTWHVPNDIYSEVYIRVREYGNPEIEYITPYIAIKGKINVDAPNGGEKYTVGQSDVVITWSVTGDMTGNARVWFAKNGVDYAYMDVTDAMGYPSGKDVNSGNLAWNPVPDEITEDGKIKVELIGDESSVYDVSDDTFSIQGGLTLTYPNGGVTLYVGATDSSRRITWDVDGDLTGQQVTLTYTVGGSGDKSIGSTAAMDGFFDWGASAGIPDDIGDNVIVKVALSSKPDTVFDVSDSANKIRGRIATISSPTSVDEWYVDSDMYNIAWTMENDAVSMGNLEIRYSTGGASFPVTQVIETNVGPLASPVSWQVPDVEGIITNSAQIKIFAINYASDILKISDEFKIKGKITITRPAHGTDYTWYVGTNENIEWTTKGIVDIDKVNVYWDEGIETYSNQIADGIANAEGFLWQNIPAEAMGNTVRVKVAGYGDYSDVYDTSPQGTKYITVKGRIVVGSPNGGEEWIAGTQYPITWTPYGDIGNVHIEYHDGTGWHDITDPETGVPATKLSEPWIIPADAAPGSAYKIRITALAPYGDIKDESNNLFTVRGSLNLTYPDGGAAQEFNVNDTEDIQWTKTGAIGNIELRYSITGTEPYLEANQIATNVSPTNQPEGEKYGAGVYYYPWSIPAPALSDTVKIKIFLISDPTGNVHDESVSTFKVKGSLQLTGEANGEGSPVWKVGENKTITWNVVGALGNIDIYYSKDGVQFLNSIVLGVPCGTGGNGSYLWEPIPNNVIDSARNTNIKLKITTPAGDVESISVNPLTIQGQIIVAQPDPILYVDDPDNPNDYYTITWTTKGIVGQ